MSRLAFLPVLLLSLISLALAQNVRLQYNVKPGDGWKTVMTMKASGTFSALGMEQEMEIEAKSTTEQKVSSVNNDGTITSSIEHRNDELRAKVGGQEVPDFPRPPGRPLMATHNRNGKLVKLDGLAALPGLPGPDIGRIMSAVIYPLPEREINVGDTWEHPADGSLIPIRIKGKLLEIGKDNGIEVARIEFTTMLSGAALNKVMRELVKAQDGISVSGVGITSTVISTIELATGMPLKGKGSIEFDIISKKNDIEVRQTFKGSIEEVTTRL